MWWAPLASKGIEAAGALAGSGDAAPSSATGSFGAGMFDNSGWTVSTGSSSAGLQLSPIVLAGAAVLALLVLWRLTKKS